MWSQPPGGASVTAYIIRYNDGGPDNIKILNSLITSYDIEDLTIGTTYTITVEAASIQLSGESEITITLRMF